MTELYAHQRDGVKFLIVHSSAMLCDEMGCGKSRQALVAAQELFAAKKIDRVLILSPAAVRYSWRTEIDKLEAQGELFIPCIYEPRTQHVYGAKNHLSTKILPVLMISYALLPQDRHLKAFAKWAAAGKTLLIADESSFLKNRTAKQTKGAAYVAKSCSYRWLLTGTPIANSPLDLYGQALVMANGSGPLKQFKNYYHFRSRYGVLQTMHVGRKSFQQVVAYQNLDELTAKFAPYVLRREKKDCLDLPEKSYIVREVQLNESTWRIYQELRRDALLALPDEDVRPEPNAAVRILRLCQLTSGHVGVTPEYNDFAPYKDERLKEVYAVNDVSSEKLDWLVEQIVDGELSNEQALIVWCRWRRERERLAHAIRCNSAHVIEVDVFELFGGQSQKQREEAIQSFQAYSGRCKRRMLIAQPHAGGYGLNLTAASTAVYLSNDFSYTTRIQSEDRCHRIGQTNAVTYVDVVAVGPKGERTVDHHVLACLRAKRDVAELTCAGWRKALAE